MFGAAAQGLFNQDDPATLSSNTAEKVMKPHAPARGILAFSRA